MDNYRGDLEDILGASSHSTGGDGDFTIGEVPITNWHFHPVPDGLDANYKNDCCFGDPFSRIEDPLLNELDEVDEPKSTFFDNSIDVSKQSVGFSPKVRHNSIFSKMIQISPNPKLPDSNDLSSPNSSKLCLVGNSMGLQISSPRNMGIKRRKSQAKKVVCIPATTPVNNRPAGGEVVPSDLWAWRKYGQKPIKGSPYPRGYYRCSSSKGCSARKQVERSRIDPHMLIITYTFEHNHPLPTQRNALAGSTRSHSSKVTNSSHKASTEAQKEHLTNMKEECNTNEQPNTIVGIEPMVKEEMNDIGNDSKVPMDLSVDNMLYRPYFPSDIMGNDHSDDFFAELGEIGDDDPLKMFFSTTPGFSGDRENVESDKAFDAFPSFFEWIGISNIDNNPTLGDSKSGL